jgi:hypothetical protein
MDEELYYIVVSIPDHSHHSVQFFQDEYAEDLGDCL